MPLALSHFYRKYSSELDITIGAADGLIAATALRHGLHLMTRNIKDFQETGVLLINPWS